MSWYQKGKTIWIFLKKETVSGSGISWAMCKSAHRCRQITTPAPHHSVFYRPDAFLPPNQQCQSTEGSTVSISIQLYPLPTITDAAGLHYIVVICQDISGFVLAALRYNKQRLELKESVGFFADATQRLRDKKRKKAALLTVHT